MIVARAGGDPAGRSRRTLVAGRGRAIRVADVIVVGAHGDVGVLQPRIAAFDDADDVVGQLRPDDLVVDVDVEPERHVVQAEGRQRLLGGRFLPQLVVRHRRAAEQERQEFVGRRDVWRNRLVEAARRREIDRRGPCPAASATAPAATVARLVGRDWRRIDAGDGSLLVGGVAASAGDDLPVRARVDGLGPIGPEKYDGGVFHVFPAVVHLARRGRIDPVPDELDARGHHGAAAALESLEGDALAILEGARLASDLDRYGRAARSADTQDPNRLEVAAGVASRLDVPLPQMLLDVGGRETEARTVDGAALHLVGRNVRQPRAQLVLPDRGQTTAGGGREKAGRQDQEDGCN